MSIAELMGFATGLALAPFAAAGSFLRRARIFHPEGVVYSAEVTPAATSGAERCLGERLAGPALVRLSGALWKGDRELPDILGAAVRFRRSSVVTPEPASDDQDLLFATARSALTLAPAVLTTNVHSFLSDDYYAITVFDTPELGRVKWRLVPTRVPGGEKSRKESLAQAVARGIAVFELQARSVQAGARYEPIARIRLVAPAVIDQAALRFSPFRAGRGIVAKGFLNAMRVAPYAASQLVRPARSRP